MNSGHKVARDVCMGFPHQCSEYGAPKHTILRVEGSSKALRWRLEARLPSEKKRTWGAVWPQARAAHSRALGLRRLASKGQRARARSSPHVDRARGQGLTRSSLCTFEGKRGTRRTRGRGGGSITQNRGSFWGSQAGVLPTPFLTLRFVVSCPLLSTLLHSSPVHTRLFSSSLLISAPHSSRFISFRHALLHSPAPCSPEPAECQGSTLKRHRTKNIQSSAECRSFGSRFGMVVLTSSTKGAEMWQRETVRNLPETHTPPSTPARPTLRNNARRGRKSRMKGPSGPGPSWSDATMGRYTKELQR